MLNHAQQERFAALRRQVIEGDFANLNPEQRQAVLATEGPLLLLAGAGSGKTTVLIHRVANLMKYGRASDSGEVSGYMTPEDLAFLEGYCQNPRPEDRGRAEGLCRLDPAPGWSILAITFTNKAAGELKHRLEKLLGPEANDVWASTFHSSCARILRRDIEKLGYPSSFTIYDTADAERVVKDVLRDLNIDDKSFPPKLVLSHISKAKDAMQLARDCVEQADKSGDYREKRIAAIYTEYEKRLKAAGALDFDDLILRTVLLLRDFREVREYYQRKFRYVLVDEYQDTNQLQYRLASLLAGGYRNFCVVGDDDQSIYRFRGATIENILSFENQYEGCRTIRLERNYRSTQNILSAANSVIAHNQGRKGKNLWTDQGDGDKVKLYTAANQDEEAQFVAAQILLGYGSGRRWRDHAVLYRMNAQSRELEMAFKRNGVPYRIIGGIRFFDRAEVKDMLAYLSVLHNPGDDLRLTRIINNPPRGIGQRTVESAQALAAQTGRSLWEVISHPLDYPALQKSAPKLGDFVKLISDLREKVGELSLPDLYDALCADSGYALALEQSEKVEDRTRLENIRELGSSIQSYLENAPEPSLGGFLDEIALYTDLDSHDPNEECVVMMTMHAAKGLEFPVVFVVGMEQGLFPGQRAIGDQDELEEERRLCYVAMTRAKERLYMTCASQRMLYGRTSANLPSRFLSEIPAERVERTGRERGYRPEPEETPRPRIPAQRPKPRYDRGYTPEPPAAKKGPLPDFHRGETVVHRAFGKGMILSVTPMGNDALLEVAFDTVGTKKLMLRSASQYMTKE